MKAPSPKELMQNVTAKFVTIEQVGVWVERRHWFDQNQATRIGFIKGTLDEIINKHLSGAIPFSAIVDGTRCTLDTETAGDFIFEIVWLQRAGLFNAGSHGNCEVRGRSIQVFLADKLTDLSCPSAEIVRCPATHTAVNGYHRAVRQIRLNREDVLRSWPPRPTTTTSTSAIPVLRDELMDALLFAASSSDFPKSPIAFFDFLRQSISSLASLSHIELEQAIARECPGFWNWVQHRWSDVGSGEKRQQFSDLGKQKAPAYIFEENNRLFYNWSLIEDSLLINMVEAGRPESHAALLLRVQDIVASKDCGPGRTENDRHFKRYERFFRATAGTGIQAGAKTRSAKDANAVRRPANRRSP
jgi:hypothetical protein